MDPAAQLKQISAEIQEKFDEAGMGKVEEFMDKMDDMMDKVKDGPGAIMKAVTDKAGEIKTTLEKALNDPASLAPGGGGLAACASWYGGAVVGKLKGFSDETEAVVAQIMKIKTDVEKPLQQLANDLKGAMDKLEAGVKALAKLPKLIMKELEGKDSPDDIAKINTGPMKKALNAGDMDGPLGVIGGLGGLVGAAIGVLAKGVQVLEDFISTAPDKVKSAFDVPVPLCFLQSVLMSQAPQIMTDLLGMIDKLKGVSLQPLMNSLNGSKDMIANLDVNAVKTPVNTFVESATGLVDKLDKTVSGAKMGGGVAKLGKMFG